VQAGVGISSKSDFDVYCSRVDGFRQSWNLLLSSLRVRTRTSTSF
jgi:hypothetical protein